MGEIPGSIPLVKPEDLPAVTTGDGKPVTRAILEENPDIVRAIQNVYGINVDMTPISASDSDSTPTS